MENMSVYKSLLHDNLRNCNLSFNEDSLRMGDGFTFHKVEISHNNVQRRVSHQVGAGCNWRPDGPLSLPHHSAGRHRATQFCPKFDLTCHTLTVKIEPFIQLWVASAFWPLFWPGSGKDITWGLDRTSLWPPERTAIALRSFWCRLRTGREFEGMSHFPRSISLWGGWEGKGLGLGLGFLGGLEDCGLSVPPEGYWAGPLLPPGVTGALSWFSFSSSGSAWSWRRRRRPQGRLRIGRRAWEKSTSSNWDGDQRSEIKTTEVGHSKTGSTKSC